MGCFGRFPIYAFSCILAVILALVISETCVQENDVTTTGLVSDRPDVTGKSTISEVRSKNITSVQQTDVNQQESTRQLPQTMKEIAAAAEAAALR